MPDDHPTESSAPKPQVKPPSSGALVVLSLILLAALVWAMSPGRPRFSPAPLRETPSGCAAKASDFVPTDVTDIPGIDWTQFTTAQKNHLLYRLNMEPCPCGCNNSVAGCLRGHVTCPTVKGLVDKMVMEEKSPQPSAP